MSREDDVFEYFSFLSSSGEDLRLPRLADGRGETPGGGVEKLRQVFPLRALVLTRLHDHLELIQVLR